MTPSPFAPYAPPQASLGPPGYLETPLPPGVRRFRLDPARYRTWVTRRILRFAGIFILAFAAFLLPFAATLFADSLLTVIPLFAIACGYGLLTTILRARNLASSNLVTYEVLLGPRVLRRTIAATLPAEILRPEVSAIFETGEGLWVSCLNPRRALFLTRALDGYDDVRSELATWRSIEPLHGLPALRRTAGLRTHQAPRDAVAGTSLASDPSLAADLEAVRAASSAAWRHYPAPQGAGRVARRVLILWVVLIVMFLAIWQLLQPGEHQDAPPRPRPATTRN
jgi:hypothetical protein